MSAATPDPLPPVALAEVEVKALVDRHGWGSVLLSLAELAGIQGKSDLFDGLSKLERKHD